MLADDVKAREEGVGVTVSEENEVGSLGFVSYLKNRCSAKVWGFGIEYGIAVMIFYWFKYFWVGADPVAFRCEFPVFVGRTGVFPHGVDFDVDVVFESIGAPDGESESHGEEPEEGEE